VVSIAFNAALCISSQRFDCAPAIIASSMARPETPKAPTGITFVDYENPPGINSSKERIESFLASDRAAWYNHVNIAAHPNGGHFIPWEIPEQWTTDLVQTFKSQLPPPPA
jgi:hypothetical protein